MSSVRTDIIEDIKATKEDVESEREDAEQEQKEKTAREEDAITSPIHPVLQIVLGLATAREDLIKQRAKDEAIEYYHNLSKLADAKVDAEVLPGIDNIKARVAVREEHLAYLKEWKAQREQRSTWTLADLERFYDRCVKCIHGEGRLKGETDEEWEMRLKSLEEQVWSVGGQHVESIKKSVPLYTNFLPARQFYQLPKVAAHWPREDSGKHACLQCTARGMPCSLTSARRNAPPAARSSCSRCLRHDDADACLLLKPDHWKRAGEKESWELAVPCEASEGRDASATASLWLEKMKGVEMDVQGGGVGTVTRGNWALPRPGIGEWPWGGKGEEEEMESLGR